MLLHTRMRPSNPPRTRHHTHHHLIQQTRLHHIKTVNEDLLKIATTLNPLHTLATAPQYPLLAILDMAAPLPSGTVPL
jgi:hypothetical protein